MKDENKLEEEVRSAMDKDDFSEVSEIIERSVEAAIQVTKSGARALYRNIMTPKEPPKLKANKNPDLVRQKITSPKSYQVLRNIGFGGAILTALSGIIGLVDGITSMAFLYNLLEFLIFGILTGGLLIFSKQMDKHARQMARFIRYRTEIDDNRVVSIEDFSTAVQLPPADVAADLSRLIKQGYFPQARIVEDSNLFLLDREAYSAYKNYYTSQPVVEEEAPREGLEEDKRQVLVNKYIKELTQKIDKIENSDFKGDAEELLTILKSIDHKIDEDPKKLEGLNKFIDYYTPTSIKLIQRYIEFEQSAVSLEDFKESKADIKHSIKTVNEAFKNLLSELFEEDFMDIQADIDVMHTLLVQDGLIDKDHGKGDRE